MTRERQKTGREGEDAAVRFLRKMGYKILDRNFRCPFGEMDIIARHGDELVFVEVRSLRSEKFGDPVESVGPVKQRKLSRIALCYLQERDLQGIKARFDVLGVKLRPEGHEIEIVRDAFDVVT